MITQKKDLKNIKNENYPILNTFFWENMLSNEEDMDQIENLYEPHLLIEKSIVVNKDREKIVSPLLYFISISDNKKEGFSNTLDILFSNSLKQIKETYNNDLIVFRNVQQKKILEIFVKNLDVKNVLSLIEWSRKVCKPHDIIKEEDIVEIIFKSKNIEALKIFSNHIKSISWNSKWSLSPDLWENTPFDFSPNSKSFWPIEYGTLDIDWLNTLLNLGCYTDAILDGVYDKKDIETITLRVLKVSISTCIPNELSQLGEGLLRIHNLWIRRDQHPINALSLLVKNNASIEGTWNSTPWWNTWLIVRKTPPYSMEFPWSKWPIDLLAIIDAMAEKKYLDREKEKWFSGKEQTKRKRL